MTVKERVKHYFDLASMPHIPYDKSRFLRELNITEDDIFNYRKKLEDEVSMKPTEKRDILIKQTIKPLLKKYGFSTSGSDWRRETDDAYIFIHLQNSHFNDIATGTRFCFHISASKKEKIVEKLSNQWMYNQMICDLTPFDFLPYCGMLSPYYSAGWYQIDGYIDYLPTDTPIEDICSQIGEDFDKYVLPELSAIQSYEDFLNLRTQKLKRYEEKEIRLIKFYHAAQVSTTAYGESVFPSLVKCRKELGLNIDDITSHLEWLDICREHHYLTKYDAKELAIKVAKN